jgi:hypothetical protein
MRLLLTLALLALAGCRSAAPLLTSTAAPVVVDGDAGEWASGLRPVPGESGLSLGLRNTPDALVVAIVAGDEWQARRVASGGLTLWLDPAGGNARRLGLRFPVGAGAPDDVPPPGAPADDGTLRGAFAASTARLEAVRAGDARPAAVGSIAGVETAAAWTARGLVVEVRLPLRGPAAAAFAGEATGPSVGLGIELAAVQRAGSALPPPASMTGRRPDGRMDGYGADRRDDGETAAPQDDVRTRTPRTTTKWIGIALAP